MIRPLSNYVVAKRIERPLSSSIVFVPESTDEDETIGDSEIIAVGPGKLKENGDREDTWGLKAGDKVRHSLRGNTPFIVDGVKVIMFRHDAVIGLIE